MIRLLVAAAAILIPVASAQSIKWETDLYVAYRVALATNKPMAVFYYTAGGQYSGIVEKGALASSQMNSLADRAVWVKADQAKQETNTQKLLKELNLQRYPVLVILDTAADRLVERGRVTGYFEPAQYYFHVSQIFLKPSKTGSSRTIEIPKTMDHVTITSLGAQGGPASNSVDTPAKR